MIVAETVAPAPPFDGMGFAGAGANSVVLVVVVVVVVVAVGADPCYASFARLSADH